MHQWMWIPRGRPGRPRGFWLKMVFVRIPILPWTYFHCQNPHSAMNVLPLSESPLCHELASTVRIPTLPWTCFYCQNPLCHEFASTVRIPTLPQTYFHCQNPNSATNLHPLSEAPLYHEQTYFHCQNSHSAMNLLPLSESPLCHELVSTVRIPTLPWTCFHCKNPHSAMNLLALSESPPISTIFYIRIMWESIAVVRVPCFVRQTHQNPMVCLVAPGDLFWQMHIIHIADKYTCTYIPTDLFGGRLTFHLFLLITILYFPQRSQNKFLNKYTHPYLALLITQNHFKWPK